MIRMIFAISLFLCGYAQAEALKDSVPNVAVVGEASEDVAPDRATLRFGVVTERPTAAAAAADNAAAIKTILDELKTMGVADADMQTEQVSLAPMQTEERDAKGKTKTTTTYRASNRLAVQIKPVEKASDIVGRVLEKGANTLDGVEYDNGGLEEKRDELRAKAVKDAERRARIYAEAAGLRTRARHRNPAARLPHAGRADLRRGSRRGPEREDVRTAAARHAECDRARFHHLGAVSLKERVDFS